MRSRLVVALLFVVAAVALAVAQDEDTTKTIQFRTDLEAARADAAESGRPLMVVFR